MKLIDADLLRHQAYVDGQWCDADEGATTEIFNPANGMSLGRVPNMGAAENRRAIDAAQVAQVAWRALTAKERAARLRDRFDAAFFEAVGPNVRAALTPTLLPKLVRAGVQQGRLCSLSASLRDFCPLSTNP